MGFTVKVVVAFAAIFVLGFLGFQWYFTEDPATSVVYKTAPLQRGDLMASIGANGTLEPEDMVDVGAQIAGQILEFGKDANGDTIDYGSVVKKGMLLARIDDFPYKIKMLKASNQVEGAKAALKKAEADLSLAKAKHYLAETDWQRAQKMLASNTLAVAGYDSYKSAFETSKASLLVNEASVIQAKAELSEAENSLSSAKQDLSYCIIKSPVDGVVIDRRVNIGQTVVSSLNAPSLFLIAKDLRKMQVWVAVNEADIGKIHPGQPVSFTVSSFPGETFKGTVSKIRLNATMTQNVVTYIVEVLTDNSENRLLPFLTANVKFELKRIDDVMIAPNAALRWMPKNLKQVDPEFRQMFSGAAKEKAKEKEQEHAKAENGKIANSKAAKDAYKNGILWVVNGDYIRPIKVKVGLSDGMASEVSGEGLEAGMEVVVREKPKKVDEMVANPFSAQGALAGRRK